MAGTKRKKGNLPTVSETLLKKRKASLEARKAAVKDRISQRALSRKEKKKGSGFKRAEKFIKEFRVKELDSKRIVKLPRCYKRIVTPEEPRVAFVVRYGGLSGLDAKTKQVFQLFRLQRVNTGVFVPINDATLRMLALLKPYVVWCYPNLKSIRDLIYKRGFAKIDGKKVGITDNAMVETALGTSGLLCKFPCNTAHCLCLSCFVEYSNTLLTDRSFKYINCIGATIECPVRSCVSDDKYITDPHHMLLLGKEKYELFKVIATELSMLHEQGIYCPNSACGMLWDASGLAPGALSFTCSPPMGCGSKICLRCRQEYHEGSCNSDISSSLSDNQLSRIEMKRISKPCPQCKVPTEKDDGCMHITCSQCAFEWCWLCLVAWDVGSCQTNHWFG